MADTHLFLRDLALVLGVAAVTSVLFQRLRLPTVLGYLLAGVLVGPNVPAMPVVSDQDTVRQLAELGVVLIMFSLGLEFSLRRLVQVAPTAGLACVVEVGLMMVLGWLLAAALGWPPGARLLAAATVAISSTMIIVRTFAEQRIPRALSDLVFGILIAEDLVAILILASLSVLGAGGAVAGTRLAGEAARLALFLAVAVVAGLLVVPRVVRAVVTLRRRETILVAAVGLCFVAAWAAQAAGYSVALGAFLAGALAAESGMVEHIEALVRPVRDMFGAIFFVSVGMLVDPGAVVANGGVILLFTALVMGGKLLGVTVGSFLTGHGTTLSLRAGTSMMQIGEFSFIIAGAGAALGAVEVSLFTIAVAVSVLTSVATPFLVRASEPFALWVDRKLPHRLQTFATLYGSWIELIRARRGGDQVRPERRLVGLVLLDAALLATVVVVVARVGPALVARLVAGASVAPVVARAVVLAGAVALAFPFALGLGRLTSALAGHLAQRALPLPARGVDHAYAPRRALQAALGLGLLLVVGAPLVLVTQPFLPPGGALAIGVLGLAALGVGFWRAAANLQGHVEAGAQVVAAALAKRARGQTRAESDEFTELAGLLPGLGHLTAIRLASGAPAAGRTLGELNLRGATGATVVAIRRGEQEIVAPRAHELLEGGDLVALTGTHEAIDAARELLEVG